MVKTLLDLIFPPKCVLCQRVQVPPLCPECREQLITGAPPEPDVFGLFTYASAHRLVQALKYERATSVAETMSRMMASFAAEHGLLQGDPLIIPVPIHPRRRQARGFNQSEMLVEAFPSALVRCDLLERTRDTPQQVGLDKLERRMNMEGAFECAEKLVGSPTVLLVDDVFTSGATVRACMDALNIAGAGRVQVLVFAAAESSSDLA